MGHFSDPKMAKKHGFWTILRPLFEALFQKGPVQIRGSKGDGLKLTIFGQPEAGPGKKGQKVDPIFAPFLTLF